MRSSGLFVANKTIILFPTQYLWDISVDKQIIVLGNGSQFKIEKIGIRVFGTYAFKSHSTI